MINDYKKNKQLAKSTETAIVKRQETTSLGKPDIPRTWGYACSQPAGCAGCTRASRLTGPLTPPGYRPTREVARTRAVPAAARAHCKVIGSPKVNGSLNCRQEQIPH